MQPLRAQRIQATMLEKGRAVVKGPLRPCEGVKTQIGCRGGEGGGSLALNTEQRRPAIQLPARRPSCLTTRRSREAEGLRGLRFFRSLSARLSVWLRSLRMIMSFMITILYPLSLDKGIFVILNLQ